MALVGSSEPPVGDEVARAWTDLLTAAAEAGYAAGELARPPASADQIAAAEQAIGRPFPPELRALYQLSDGQVDWLELSGGEPPRQRGHWVCSLFGAGWTFNPLGQLRAEYTGWADIRSYYSPRELAGEFDRAVTVRGTDPVKRLYTSADSIPFATDGGGNSLAADVAPEPGGAVGQVIVIGSDEDTRRVVAPGIAALLRLCAARL